MSAPSPVTIARQKVFLTDFLSLLSSHAEWVLRCCADTALDEPPRARDGAIITPTVAKAILGQAALQLGVLAALLGPLGAAVMAVGGDAAAATGLDAADHTAQYTLVFNTFVIMQLFNQVRLAADSSTH